MSLSPWLVGILLLAAGAAHAQIYRWVDQNGRVQYSNQKPPKEIKATVVDPDAKAGPEAPGSPECYTARCQGERLEARQRQRDAGDAKDAAARAAAAPKAPRGLDFRNYVRIQRGMTEGELLGIAGEPDFVSDQGIAIDAPTAVQVDRNTRVAASGGQRMVSWTYLPTPGDPFTTTITLIGGRVSELDRARKF
ncbi:MAG: DUF4124 domain-containing protein [Burkholderiales bacterium]